MHSNIVMPYITHIGTQEQKEKYIAPMMAGKVIGAIAMTEPGAGRWVGLDHLLTFTSAFDLTPPKPWTLMPWPFSDLQGIRTYAKQDGDDWILNGSKTFITNGWMAGVTIVVAVTNPTAKSPAHGITLFLVDDGTPGFKKGKKLHKMGYKAQVGNCTNHLNPKPTQGTPYTISITDC